MSVRSPCDTNTFFYDPMVYWQGLCMAIHVEDDIVFAGAGSVNKKVVEAH